MTMTMSDSNIPKRSIADHVRHIQMRWRWRAHGTDLGSIDTTQEAVEKGIVYGFVGGVRALGGRPDVDADGDRSPDS